MTLRQSTFSPYIHVLSHVVVVADRIHINLFTMKQAISKLTVWYAENPYIYDVIALCTKNEPYPQNCQTILSLSNRVAQKYCVLGNSNTKVILLNETIHNNWSENKKLIPYQFKNMYSDHFD